MISPFIEMLRRLCQIFLGCFMFDFPLFMAFRNIYYKLELTAFGRGNVISQKVMFYVPHGGKRANVLIDDRVRISENVKIDCASPVHIENDVWISENTHIFNHDHVIFGKEIKSSKSIALTKGIVIEQDAWVGANSLILPKVSRIGKGSVIGAGSVVTKNVEDYTIVAGNPAKVIGQRV